MFSDYPWLANAERQLLSSARSLPFRIVLCGYLLLCSVLAGLFIWGELRFRDASLPLEDPTIFLHFLVVLVFACSMLGMPAYAALSLIQEKERNAYEQLRISLVTPAGLAASAWLHVFGLSLACFVVAFPAAALVVGLGVPVSWGQLLPIIVLVLSTVTTCAMVGVLFSAACRRRSDALAGSYMAMMVITGIALGLLLLLLSAGGVIFLHEDRISEVSRFIVLLLLSPERTDLGWHAWPIYFHLGVQSVLFVGSWYLAARCLRRPLEAVLPKVDGTAARPSPEPAPSRKRTQQLSRHHETLPAIPDRQNPVFARESRYHPSSNRRRRLFLGGTVFLVGLVAGGALLPFDTLWIQNEYWDQIQVSWVLCLIAPILLCASVQTSNMLGKEIRQDNLDMLRLSLMTPRSIVWGKFLAGWRAVTPLLCGAMAAGLVAVVFTNIRWDLVVAGMGMLVIMSTFALALGLFVSLTEKEPTQAHVASVGCMLLVSGCLHAAAVLFFGVSGGSWLAEDLMANALFVTSSPLVLFVTQAIAQDSASSLNTLWLAHVLFFLLLTIGCVELTAWGFGRFRFRAR